jgi:hypothetical protein
MTRHILQGRDERELLWYHRRTFLRAAAAWTALGGLPAALAQQRSNIIELVGDARLNGVRLLPEHTIQTGDAIETGPGTSLVFVLGNASFKVRQNARLAVERGTSIHAVSLLRLLAGGVASVWGQGVRRQIQLPTLTAGIRGTGVYAEVPPNQNGRSYLCNCYGTVDLASGGDSVTSQTDYHEAYWGEVQPRNGRWLTPAAALNHGDEEIEALARLVGQRARWQELGRKGPTVSPGYSGDNPGSGYPARPPGN